MNLMCTPEEKAGLLASELFRAVPLVVDTGIPYGQNVRSTWRRWTCDDGQST
jgi:uncharacterized protein (DUF885 family)